jgi:hypothetical protein
MLNVLSQLKARFEAESEDYTSQTNLLQSFDGYDVFYENLSFTMQSNEILVVRTNLQHGVYNPVQDRNLDMEQQFNEVEIIPQISTKYSSVTFEPIEFQNKYLTKSFRPYSCWATLLLNLYRQPKE